MPTLKPIYRKRKATSITNYFHNLFFLLSLFLGWVLGLNKINPQAAEIEQKKNALALAVYPPGHETSGPSNSFSLRGWRKWLAACTSHTT
ncbi:hypothetical protein Bca101_001302 [Brassica carinata]